MQVPPQIRLNLGKIFLITVVYMLIALFLAVLNYSILTSPFSQGPSQLFDLENLVTVNLITALFAGIFGGTSLIIANGSLFRRRPFGFALLFTFISYCLIFAMLVVINIGITARFFLGANADLDTMFWILLERVSDLGLLTYFTLWLFITLATLFFLQVNDKFGPGILVKFLMGQYHIPRDEERIFMFLDMRSSTTIAELIGHKEYFNLLRDVFADITGTILRYRGEIYQYVGDEIIISWALPTGVKNSNCIRCFLEIEERLQQASTVYKERYGHAPEFKAGLHYGTVTAGEVGIIKKDIVYSGDVLNTAARIQEQCNQYGVNLLLSENLFHLLEQDGEYELIELGEIQLRGKDEVIALSSLKRAYKLQPVPKLK